MIAFLKQLRLAQHADVDLRRDLIWVLRLMLAIPTPDRLDVSAEVIEELPPSRRDVPTESTPIVSPPQQHEVVELQQRFDPLAAEEIEPIIDDRIKKLVSREHVLPHGVAKVVTTAIERRIDFREVTLHIPQRIVDALEVQSRPRHLQQ